MKRANEVASKQSGTLTGIIDPSKVDNPCWTMGEWRGMTQWRCALCAWDTLDGEDAIRAHFEAAHVRVVATGVLGPDGKEIVRREVHH